MIPMTVPVALGDRAYDIRIAPGLLGRAGAEMAPLLARPRIAVVTDTRVAPAHLETLRSGCAAAGISMAARQVPAGEASKAWGELERTVEWLIAERVERDDMVVTLGGGVVGDLAGFAAAVLRRGVRYVQIPTTLLAQVDSAVGGKTGINSAAGKNLVGAFHQPALVLADPEALATLSHRELLAGYGEVAKYAALGDAAFFDWLEINGPLLARGDRDAQAEAVRRCCEMKAALVARDERESGERALLNLGHTFGHALEAATGYSDRLRHGEGVAIGCRLAFDLSARLGHCDPAAAARLAEHLAAMGLPADLADIPGELPDADGLLTLMAQDKKVREGRLAFILARRIGEAIVCPDVAPEAVRNLLGEALARRLSAGRAHH